MITIDINKKQDLEYSIKVEGENKVVSAKLVVTFTDNMTRRFDAVVKDKIITVPLPPLKEGIGATVANCYLELQDSDNLFYRVCEDKISFEKKPKRGVLGLGAFKAKPVVRLKKTKQEIRIKPPVIPAADYFPKPQRPPTRKEVIKMANFFNLKK